MVFDFRFKVVDCTKELKLLVDFLIKQDLGYPDYENWVQRSEDEIEKGLKISIISLYEDKIVADLIYQEHKELFNSLEMTSSPS